jgi:hypothetical protein
MPQVARIPPSLLPVLIRQISPIPVPSHFHFIRVRTAGTSACSACSAFPFYKCRSVRSVKSAFHRASICGNPCLPAQTGLSVGRQVRNLRQHRVRISAFPRSLFISAHQSDQSNSCSIPLPSAEICAICGNTIYEHSEHVFFVGVFEIKIPFSQAYYCVPLASFW